MDLRITGLSYCRIGYCEEHLVGILTNGLYTSGTIFLHCSLQTLVVERGTYGDNSMVFREGNDESELEEVVRGKRDIH